MAARDEELQALLDRLEPKVARAFLDSMADWRDSVDLTALQAAIARGDINGAIDALHLDPAALTPLLKEVEGAYMDGGNGLAASLPRLTSPLTGARFTVRFGGQFPEVEQDLRTISSTLVTRITESQREGVRIALAASMAKGEGPRTTALAIVGRVGQDGKRQGGIIGLTADQATYLQSAKAELASGDPEQLRNYLTRALRDKRFDPTVRKAIESGAPIPADRQAKMVTSYSNQLLKLRGTNIGRTETLGAIHAGEHAAMRQAIATGAIDASRVTKRWSSAHDKRVRDTHAIMSGQMVKFDEPFRSPLGALLMYPGDRSLGAPASEIINCRCIAPIRVRYIEGK